MTDTKLVAITSPKIEGISSPEEFIAYAARVSNPSNQMNNETAPKLIKYLLKNKHLSPFEMVHATVEINTTRDIARQILRHRSFSFQEFSQRYQTIDSLGFVTREARLQDTRNRQNSVKIDEASPLVDEWEARQKEIIDKVNDSYQWAIQNGIAKEQARAILPEGCTMSRVYMSGSIRSFFHYIQLRIAHGTQLEHQEVAKSIKKVLEKEFPITFSMIDEV